MGSASRQGDARHAHDEDEHEDLEQHLLRCGEIWGEMRCGKVWAVLGDMGRRRGGAGRYGEMRILERHLVEVARVVDGVEQRRRLAEEGVGTLL